MRRIARSVLALGVLVLSCLVLPGHAQSADPARQFVEFANAAEFTPAVQLASQREMTVVLKLADDPVAVVRSRRADKRVSDSERNTIEADLRGKQQALLPSIRSHGGRVRAMFQNAINGVKVQATRQQIAAMAALPGVVDVKTVALHHLDNAVSVPFIGAPAVWQGPPGLRGEHIRVAIIDTGIDYTHANFGGPGTVAAFLDANARSTSPADPALFGPAAPKVKGGTDLVGDDYDPGSDDPAKQVPHPDPNPLDCNGHGSHVAGTAAGFGVTAAGRTFHGPYDATTPSMSFRIGPGVAPLADLYAVRVFGCQGGTDVVIDAIDWAVQHDMQVINMSLGAPFGTEDSASAEASENAVEAGIVVAAASGNDGPIPYVTSSPASGDKVISVAAVDSTAAFAGVNMALNTGRTVAALNANLATVVDGTTLPLFVLPDTAGTGAGGVSLGCDEAEYGPAVVGKIVVTFRGVCARVQRAVFGQAHGAAAVVMINNAPGYPPVEGPIPGVTIPFLGVQGASAATLSADGNALKAAATATLSNTSIANPTFRTFASFTSSGPRTDDGHVKPNITAPGVSINSTNIGTGNDSIRLSGTSMATPHVAGVAALTIEAHPDWTAEQISHAIVNTGDPDIIIGRSVRNGGAGLVRPLPATRTSVIAMGHSGEPSLSFGVEEFTHDFSDDETLTLQNLGNRSATFAVSVIKDAVSKPHSIDVNPSIVSVGPHGRATLHVKLNVPIATVGNFSAFRDVGGIVRLTPMSATANGGAALSVPYYLVARARSEIETRLKRGGDDEGGSTSALSVRVDNKSDTLTGTADFYAWGLGAKKSSAGVPRIALRAAGVQSFDLAGRKTLVFAVNTVGRWSSASMNEIDVLIDVNNDGTPDFLVVGADLGLLQGAGFSGQIASAVFNLSTGRGIVRFLAVAPNDGNTILLPVRASDVSVTAGSPRFAYTVQSFDLFSAASDAFDTEASFNAFTNAISTGAFVSVGPHGRVSVPITIDPTEFAVTPALGVMTVSLDNVTRGHRQQAQLLKLKGDDGQ
jgi:minor extracellular serine protease Vpr